MLTRRAKSAAFLTVIVAVAAAVFAGAQPVQVHAAVKSPLACQQIVVLPQPEMEFSTADGTLIRTGGRLMDKERRNFTGQQKLAILRAHLIEKTPVSEVCDKHGISPTLFYQWQKKLFEDGAATFDSPKGRPRRQEDAQTRRIEALEAKLRQKNEVLAELMQEHIQLKKDLGEL